MRMPMGRPHEALAVRTCGHRVRMDEWSSVDARDDSGESGRRARGWSEVLLVKLTKS